MRAMRRAISRSAMPESPAGAPSPAKDRVETTDAAIAAIVMVRVQSAKPIFRVIEYAGEFAWRKGFVNSRKGCSLARLFFVSGIFFCHGRLFITNGGPDLPSLDSTIVAESSPIS